MESLTKLEWYCKERNIHCERNVPLAGHCTFKIGGPAALLIHPVRIGEIGEVLAASTKFRIPLLVLGKGSNMLFPDEGFHGAVLLIGSGCADICLVGEVMIDCESGASLSQLCLFAQEHGLAGLEFAYGIPGSVGGAIYMNAGAYGGEMKDVLVSARHADTRGQAGSFTGEQLRLSYRHSAYSDSSYVITGGVFRLRKDDPAAIRARMDDYMGRRRFKQPLEYPSAGSTFKRPEGAYASALIDQCGLKGRRIGGAMVSEKHAGFLINAGGATCADVRALIAEVRRVVQEKTGFLLETEVKMIEP